MKGLISLLLIAFLIAGAVDYYVKPIGVDSFSENNPIAFVADNIWSPITSSFMETPSNVISMPDNNLDFEQGTIGWHLHYLYSTPPDYWETTFEDAKSGRMSLRIAHNCDSSTTSGLHTIDASRCLFRTDKLPAFDNNVYVKFYIKTARKYENTWWPSDLFEFSSLTTYSLNVEAIDEWGERVYTKNITHDIYDYQNSQLYKIVEYDYSNNASAVDYFKKINQMDYNATVHGSLDQIQAMIDLQNTMLSGKVLYYVTNTDELPKSSYAVYLGDGWYTIIMPVPKETRYLGFSSQVYCSGQNEGWMPSGFGGYWYFPDAPATATTLTYLDGITFISAITNSDVGVVTTNNTTNTANDNNWSDDIDNSDSNGASSTSKTTKIWGFLVFIGLIILLILATSPKARKGVLMFGKKKRIIPKGAGVKMPKAPKMAPTQQNNRVQVRSYSRAPKGEAGGKFL